MSKGVNRFTNLRAWQACGAYKKAMYRLCLERPLSRDWKRRDQLEESVAGPAGHLSEGFGRFSPPDFARFTVIARSSLMESQNHLRDAVDKNYITEETRLQLDALAVVALKEVTGLMEYLQSPEALRNARRARERRIASREQRRANRAIGTNQEPTNTEPGTEPEPEHEPRSEKSEG
jgi:four helix bundle protein